MAQLPCKVLLRSFTATQGAVDGKEWAWSQYMASPGKRVADLPDL